MKRALIDINIILDILNKREDHQSAARIMDMCVDNILEGFLCSHEITTLSYFLERQKYPTDQRDFIISKLLDIFKIIPATEQILRYALNSPISDYEDAVIEVSAVEKEISLIVTRNIKDFQSGRINACNAVEALTILEEN